MRVRACVTAPIEACMLRAPGQMFALEEWGDVVGGEQLARLPAEFREL